MDQLIKVIKRENNWIFIFEFNWILDETNTDKTFSEIYEIIWDFSEKKIILNFRWLDYLNSKWIWYIADLHWNTEENEWQLYITNTTEKIKDILELVWMDLILPMVETEEEAVKMLSE